MLFREPVCGVNPVKQYILKITLELPPEPSSREGRCGFTVIKEEMPWNRDWLYAVLSMVRRVVPRELFSSLGGWKSFFSLIIIL